MLRCIRCILLLLVLALAVPSITLLPVTAAAGDQAVSDAKTKEGVLHAEESRNQALQKGDADALAKLYTDDLIYTNALGVTLSKEQHLADIRSRKLKLSAFKHSNVEVRVHGDTGFVTGVSTSMVDFSRQRVR